MRTLRVRKEEDGMTKRKSTKPKPPEVRCAFCAYMVEIDAKRRLVPAPLAVEVVETPNGPRALCARHARDAVRA